MYKRQDEDSGGSRSRRKHPRVYGIQQGDFYYVVDLADGRVSVEYRPGGTTGDKTVLQYSNRRHPKRTIRVGDRSLEVSPEGVSADLPQRRGGGIVQTRAPRIIRS